MMEGRMVVNLPSYVKQIPYYDLNATLFISLLCFFITLLLVFKLTRRRRSKHNLPPSPPELPFIGNYHQLGALPHRSFQALSKNYGPLMLFQLGQLHVLVISSADLAREVMQTHDVVFASRPHHKSTRILLYGCKDVAFESYGEIWRQKRKLCVVELLSVKRVQSVQFIREEEVKSMVNRIRNIKASCMNGSGASSNGCCVINLSEMIIATTNNIISRCIFGRKYDVEGGGGNCRFGEIVREVMVRVLDFFVGDLFPSLGWVDVLTGKVKEFKATFGVLDAFFDHVIAEHKMARKEGDNKDFLDILLQHQEDDKLDFELTNDDLKALIMDMFLGGIDTTSTTVEWAVAELINNPATMKKAQEVVRRVVGNKSKLDENCVNQMDYLKCVIKETLRLHPAAPLLAPRETTSKVKLRGYDIPEKTMVYVNAWAIQRDPEFWERPEDFLPERFENSQVNFNGQDFQFIPFGSGRRKCPGMTFGLASAEYMLANLLCWFDWKVPGAGAPGHGLDMGERFGLTVNKKVPLYLEPIPFFNI